MISRYGLALDRAIDSMAGSYLKTVRYKSVHGYLCPECGGVKGSGYWMCRGCSLIHGSASAIGAGHLLADRLAFGVYAPEPRSQSLKMMYGYKDEHPASPDYRTLVRAILALGIVGHGDCLNAVAGGSPVAWAMVPSTRQSPRYGKPHPFHEIATSVMGGLPEVEITASEGEKRRFDPERFHIESAPDLNGNVLLLDDSWVTGANVQSVAACLKTAGAEQVSIYCVARIVNYNYLESLSPDAVALFQKNVHYAGGFCPWNRKREIPNSNVDLCNRT